MKSWPDGYGRRVLDEVTSTLDEARRVAGGLSGPEWILARRQTAARGRRGRAWAMAPGNFAATLVMRPQGTPDQAALRSFVAALALADALAEVAECGPDLTLKWPNDVLLNGGKVAGILLESLGQGQGVSHLAIGIGVNLAAAPGRDDVEPGALRPVSVLGETGVDMAAEDFLDVLARAFADWEARFAAYGFAPIRQAWLARAARRGAPITARTGTAEIKGIFADMDNQGQLVLETREGRVAIPAADVYF